MLSLLLRSCDWRSCGWRSCDCLLLRSGAVLVRSGGIFTTFPMGRGEGISVGPHSSVALLEGCKRCAGLSTAALWLQPTRYSKACISRMCARRLLPRGASVEPTRNRRKAEILHSAPARCNHRIVKRVFRGLSIICCARPITIDCDGAWWSGGDLLSGWSTVELYRRCECDAVL